MICATCKGHVIWEGPAASMHKRCIDCGVIGGEIIAEDDTEDEAEEGQGACMVCQGDLGPGEIDICERCDFTMKQGQR